MESREYQDKQCADIIAQIERRRTVCCQLPTGGGKTVEFSIIIKRFLQKLIDIEHGPVLILVHREELLNQTAAAIKEVLGFDPCLITSSTSKYYMARVYVGMVDSTLPRMHLMVTPSMIIIDECHINSFNKIHREFPQTKILGFSATPISAQKKDPLKKYYETIVCGPSIKWLINEGYLAQNITRAPKGSVDPSSFTTDAKSGDYNTFQMATAYRMTSNVTNAVNQYHKFCLRKKTLIFNVSIEHSKEVDSCFNACGYKSRHLDASSSSRPSTVINPETGKVFEDERKEIFHWFKTTKDAILNSVMIPTMGFDEPTVEAIILNFSTMSLAKFIQCCGRGSRVVNEYFIEKFWMKYPYELKLKTHFTILDLGKNWERFGDWNEERDWERIFNYPDFPGDGVAPIKTCPECEALVHAAARVCPFCGHEFAKKQVKQADIEEMILITKGINIDALVEKSELKHKYYGMFELAVDIVNNMFYMHGGNPSQNIVNRFFRMYYGLCIEWYKRTLSGKEDELEDISDSGWHIRKAKHNFNALIQRKNKDNAIVLESNLRELVTLNEEEYSKEIKRKEQNWQDYKQINWA